MKALARLLPSPATVASLFILPLVLTAYFLTTRYSEQVIASGQVSYLDFQSSFLANFFFSQAWVNWFNELLDFAIWGVVAAIVLVLIWAFGATRVAVENHYAEESFLHFKASKTTWHGKFWAVMSIRVLLVIISVYCIIKILVQTIPELAQDVEKALHAFGTDNSIAVLAAILKMVFLQYIIVLCISLFGHLNSE